MNNSPHEGEEREGSGEWKPDPCHSPLTTHHSPLFMPEYDHSVEILLHLRCKPCGGWWTIGDGQPDRHYFCTYCGKELQPAQYPDFPPKNLTLTTGELPL